MLISSVIFALVHFIGDPNTLPFLPALAGLGAVLAVVTLRTGDLSTAIFIHAGFNLTTTILFLADEWSALRPGPVLGNKLLHKILASSAARTAPARGSDPGRGGSLPPAQKAAATRDSPGRRQTWNAKNVFRSDPNLAVPAPAEDKDQHTTDSKSSSRRFWRHPAAPAGPQPGVGPPGPDPGPTMGA